MECEGFAHAEATPPKHNHERSETGGRDAGACDFHYRHDLLDPRWVGRIAAPFVAWRTTHEVAGERGRRAAAASGVEHLSPLLAPPSPSGSATAFRPKQKLTSPGRTGPVATDWFRSESWSDADREFFEEKLRRARPHSRAQYVRIQGVTLATSPDRRARHAAGDLLQRVVEEFSDDELQVAMAHADLGRWHRESGRLSEAAEHFREAVAMEDRMGNLHTGSDLDLAEVLAETETAPDEARALLDRARDSGLAFKSQRWRWFVTDARLAAQGGDDARKRESAREALSLLDDHAPDFARHPDLGHIETDRRTLKEVRRLAK